ncbi:MAG: ATP-binding protein [bacterium]|nr:ATP-binding protein [bacterium]
MKKKGEFYLGKVFDLKKKEKTDAELMYPSEDLTTHGLCVGMTGSGKTGLSVCLIEEAGLQGIPSIVLDIKGDLTNLLLTFPELSEADFAEWVRTEDAKKKGISVEEYGAKQADLWRNGLADWGLSGDDIAELRDKVNFEIYTPGSDAVRSLNILGSFAAPEADWDGESEELRDRISTIVSAVLSLIDYDTDPINSTEHVFLSNLFEKKWREGIDLDFNGIIHDIKNPPLKQLGALALDEVFPEKDRKKLMLALNNLLAAPTFKDWVNLKDPPIDIDNLISSNGKPNCCIMYMAHLSDQERMFFVTLLLQQLAGWMRVQPGTGNLRLLLYIDEVFGYIPSHPYYPPSKKPLTTIIKQGRAFGLGALLSAQNPGDFDYKTLSNCGTWFIGRLNTQRDKDKVLEGLESIGLEGKGLSRKWLDKAISSLGKRVFVLHNVHDKKSPYVFHTRWAMSYLRGPLTKTEIKRFKGKPKSVTITESKETTPEDKKGDKMSATPASNEDLARIVVQEYFIRSQMGAAKYKPLLYAKARVNFQRARPEVYTDLDVIRTVPADDGVISPRWDDNVLAVNEKELKNGRPPGEPGAVSPMFTSTEALDKAKADLQKYLKAKVNLTVFYNKGIKAASEPGESRDGFLKRCDQLADEESEEKLEKLKDKYRKKLDTLERKILKEQADVEKAEARMDGVNSGTIASLGGGALSILFGTKSRKLTGTKEILRGVTGTSRTRSRKKVFKTEISTSEDLIMRYQEDIEALEDGLIEEARRIEEKWENVADDVRELKLKPKYVEIDEFALLWVAE